MENKNLYHLHDRAGAELTPLFESSSLNNYLLTVNRDNLEYVLLRINHSLSTVAFQGGKFKEPGLDIQNSFFKIIENNIYGPRTKIYFIEGLYSLCLNPETGFSINERLNRSNLDDNLKEYNDSLYHAFKKYKKELEGYETIRFYYGIDSLTNFIQKVFEDTHPIMFLQLLYFNPGLVVNVKELSQLKQNALMGLINNAKSISFFSSYRLAYLNELLLDANYSVRFLDNIMSNAGKQEFIKQLEE